jgi:acetyl esterase/lipase
MIVEHRNKNSFGMSLFLSLLSLIKRINKRSLLSFVVKKRQEFIKPKKKHKANTFIIEGINVLKFGTNSKEKKIIIYFHGGGYVLKGTRRHYNFIMNLSKLVGIDSYYVDYPIAPDNKAKSVIKQSLLVVEKIEEMTKAKEVIFLGDSAGANLALVLSKHKENIKKLFLMSPWLDLTMTNPDIVDLEEKELMFTKEELLSAARDYQGSYDLSDGQISPINEDFGDKSIFIFAGTDDILYPDVLRFHHKNPGIILHSYYKLPHDFMFIFQGKEQNRVIEQIAKYLQLERN